MTEFPLIQIYVNAICIEINNIMWNRNLVTLYSSCIFSITFRFKRQHLKRYRKGFLVQRLLTKRNFNVGMNFTLWCIHCFHFFFIASLTCIYMLLLWFLLLICLLLFCYSVKETILYTYNMFVFRIRRFAYWNSKILYCEHDGLQIVLY